VEGGEVEEGSVDDSMEVVVACDHHVGVGTCKVAHLERLQEQHLASLGQDGVVAEEEEDKDMPCQASEERHA
jgi:hypothetical protein